MRPPHGHAERLPPERRRLVAPGPIGTPFNFRTTNLQKCAVVPRRARIESAWTLVSLTSRLPSHGRRWSSNPPGKCSSERPTRGTVCGVSAAHVACAALTPVVWQ